MSTMPPVSPDLHDILAKSTPPESLITHTWQVLSRLSDQRRIRPTLADDIGEPRLWHWLYWGTFLHDFGKAAGGFQDVLNRRTRRWGFRHEALSLAFVDWLFPGDHPDRPFVIAVIACHHRNADMITQNYSRNQHNPEEDSATQMIAQLDQANIRRLYQWIVDYGLIWAQALDFAPHLDQVALPPLDIALTQITPNAIHRAVRELKRYVQQLGMGDGRAVILGALLRGLIVTSDHAGSAGCEPFQPAPLERETVLAYLKTSSLFQHQIDADNASQGSMLLISPTSSGKTEAAMLWVARQQIHDERSAPRLFYMLPYQASMNATYDRMRRLFTAKDEVGLQHSRMEQVLYAKALTHETDTNAAVNYAKQQSAIARLLAFSVTVMSPYQLLKVPYQLKGFEALLTHFYGGRFIMDEIHAYDPQRAALIIAMIRYLVHHCGARFFIMTATLPPPIRRAIHDAIPDLAVVSANRETFEHFQRHRVHVLSDDLLTPEVVEHIVNDAADKSILIGCNTVRRALEVYAVINQALRAHYPDDDVRVIVIHSRFSIRDRSRKEQEIIKYTGVNQVRQGRTVVIATQVVEVSLNIDLDTIYTEAAPLEALLQRFGRVNRARKERSIADVYIMREQPDAFKMIYQPDLVAAALEKLTSIDGQPINESLVDSWLADIYTGEVLTRWQAEYDQSQTQFEEQVMRFFTPFESSGLDDLFFRMFDGVDVLPFQHIDEYEALCKHGKYLEATGLLVPIAWRDYRRLEHSRKAWREALNDNGRAKDSKGEVFIVDVPYSEHDGLDLYAAYRDNLPPKTGVDNYDVPPEAD